MVFRVLGKKIKIVTSPCGWLGTRDVSEPNDLSTCSLLLQSTNTGIMTNPTRPVCLAQSGHIESNTGKSARQGNLTRGCRRFPCLTLFASVWFYVSLLSAVFSFVFVCKQSYFPFMSIKCNNMADCEDLRVYKRLKTYIQWIVYFKKEKHGELGGGGSWHKLYSMHLPVKRTWFFLSCTSAR